MAYILREEFIRQLPQARHGCGVLILDDQQRILMLHDAPNPDRPKGRWLFAGGMLDHGETPLDAALRETYEETGLRLEQIVPVATEFWPSSDGWPTVTNYFFAAPPLTPQQAASVRLSEEHEAYRFAPLEQWRGVASADQVRLVESMLDAHRHGHAVISINDAPYRYEP